MKAYIVDPCVGHALMHGMSRPFDRYDFPHDHFPAWFERFVPRRGLFSRIVRAALGEDGMANLTGVTGSSGTGADMYTFGTTQRHPLGTVAYTKDGRMYRYSTAGAATLVIGNLLQSAAPIPNHLGLTSAAQAVGDGNPAGNLLNGNVGALIAVTPGGTGGAANLYAEGTLMVSTTPGLGQSLRVAGHPAITASTAFNVTLDIDDLIQTALTASSKYGLHHNPWKNVIQTPTTITAKVAGVAVAAITSNSTSQNYGWIQTRGAACVLINGTPAVTAPVINGASTAGSVDVWTSAAQATANYVGEMMQVGVSTECDAVFLKID